MWFTIKFDIGKKSDIPVEIEADTEAEAIAEFKAFLLNLDENGNEPRGWDGWIDDFKISVDGEDMHPIVFQPKWVSSFEIFEGRSQNYGWKYGR